MSRLTLSLLGSFQATLDNAPVTTFESDKVRALLAYLAVESDRPQRREMLAGLLWPDMAERDARTNLRHVLANLRKVLGDRTAAQPFLLTSRQTLHFNVKSDYQLDVQAFTDAIAATARHSHTRVEDCETCVARLREAAGLYSGDFLAGFSLDSDLFEAWITTQREKLHIQALDVLDHLATYHEQRSDYAEVIRYAHRQVDLEPWRESAHRQWMRALACSGQRGMALAQYEACRRILETELGIEPETATTALYENIRCGELQPSARSSPDIQPAPTSIVSPVPQPAVPSPPVPTLVPQGERRMVTLLLADLRGTAALAQLDAEAWAELITPALLLLGAEITRLGGNVQQYRQTGLMACFGGQIAHEDDSERAVLVALAMRKALAAYLTERDVAGLSLTVSVHTGEVIRTPIGDTTSIMGTVVESAEAIQASLAPGTVWVSEETHRLVAPLFTWVPLGENGYEPLAHRPQVDKGRGIAGLFSPLVGRDVELRILQEAVERLHSGIGGIVTVVGEAGIGKSRLVAELKRSAISVQPSAGL
ncbi:MAG: AAA family ATPase, partial [Anaerolineae bacterium]|nr:AAA family ATPase [Anaerolineae bacterium]